MRMTEFCYRNGVLFEKLYKPYNYDDSTDDYHYVNYVTQSMSSNFDIKEYLKEEDDNGRRGIALDME